MACPCLLDCLKMVSTTAAGMFAGGALYINLVEQPSRVDLPVKYQRQQWKNSFNLAAVRLPSLGLISSVASTAVYCLDETTDASLARLWLVPLGTFLLGSVWTVTMMLPDIKIMLDDGCIEKKGEEWVRDGIATWTKRHGIRTLADLAAFGCVLYVAMHGK